MKKFFFLLTALSMIFAFSCSQPGIGQNPSPDEGSLVIKLPGNAGRVATADDVDRFVIRITCEENFYDETQTGAPGDTIVINGLFPGTYTIRIDAHDDDLAPAETVIFTGTADAVVQAGLQTPVIIQLDYATGGLIIGIEFPDGPPTPVSERYTGWETATYSGRRIFNEDGVLTGIVSYSRVEGGDWNVKVGETFTIDPVTGYRTGSVKTLGDGTVIATSTITQNADGMETGIYYNNLSSAPDYLVLPVQITATLNPAGTGYTLVESLDEYGAVLHREIWEDDGEWAGWGENSVRMEYNEETGTYDRIVKPITVHTYDRYPETNLYSRENIYVSGELDSYTLFDLDDGFYSGQRNYTGDGVLTSHIVYGNAVFIDGIYMQAAAEYDADDNLIDEFTKFTSPGMFDAGSSRSGKSIYEEGYQAGGIIVAW